MRFSPSTTSLVLAAMFALPLGAEGAGSPAPKHRITSRVLADRGVLYVASSAPLLYAVSAADGTELWRLRPGGAIEDLAIHAGTIFLAIGSDLHAVDLATQKTRWVFHGERRIARAGITFDHGLVFFEELFGSLYAVDERTGIERWRQHTDGGLLTLAVSAGLLLEGGHAGVLRAFDTRTGKERWRRSPIPEPGLAVVGQTLFVHATDGFVRALDVATGRERWRYESGAVIGAGPPEPAFGKVFVTGYAGGSDPGTLFALDAATGKLRWRVTPPSRDVALARRGAQLVATIFPRDPLANAETEVLALDPASGRTLRRTKHPSAPEEELVPGATLYVEPQALRAVDRRTKEVRWRFVARFFEPEGTITSGRAAPKLCPLGLEPTSLVHVRDHRGQRLDLGTAIAPGEGAVAYVTHDLERSRVMVFRMLELAKPFVRELPLFADVWSVAGAGDGRVAIASRLLDDPKAAPDRGGALAISLVSAADDLLSTSTVALGREAALRPKLAWANDRVAAVWMARTPDGTTALRAAVLDTSGRAPPSALTIVEDRRLEVGSRLIPGEHDVAWDGEAFLVAYARRGADGGMTVGLARISREGALLDTRRLDTVELPEHQEGVVDLAGTPEGTGIVYAGRFAVLHRWGSFKFGPIPLPRHPDLPVQPAEARVAWNGQMFGIAWALSHDDSQVYVTVADAAGNLADATPLGRGTGAQYFDLVPAERGFFAMYIPDDAGKRRARAAVGTWLACKRD